MSSSILTYSFAKLINFFSKFSVIDGVNFNDVKLYKFAIVFVWYVFEPRYYFRSISPLLKVYFRGNYLIYFV